MYNMEEIKQKIIDTERSKSDILIYINDYHIWYDCTGKKNEISVHDNHNLTLKFYDFVSKVEYDDNIICFICDTEFGTIELKFGCEDIDSIST